MRVLMITLCLGVGLTVLGPAPGDGAETKQLTAQQQRMQTCNAEVKTKKLTGDARKSFMSQCLSGKTTAESGMTPQQQKMKTCNQEASAKKLTGDARKSFMSTCLKGS